MKSYQPEMANLYLSLVLLGASSIFWFYIRFPTMLVLLQHIHHYFFPLPCVMSLQETTAFCNNWYVSHFISKDSHGKLQII